MRRSTDPAHRVRARRARPRTTALRGPLLLLALLLSAAMAAATTSAQEGAACDPSAAPGAPNACQKQQAPPAEQPGEQPPEEKPPEEEPPPKPPPPLPPQPQAPPPPAARAVCPDGTWAPCPDPAQAEAEEPDESTQPRRRRSCRKRRGVRRPKYCPRLRRQADEERSGKRRGKKKSREERRRIARRRILRLRVERREQCEKVSAGQLMPVATLGRCAKNPDINDLYLAGRLPSRPLGDPLPPGSRLDAGFARLLERVAGDRWPTVLAMLRTQGKTGAAPAEAAELGELADKAGDGDGGGERVDALADYHRAVGLEGLTQGLHAAKGDLIRRVLSNGKVQIYPGGRFDVSSGRIDVRVLVTMLYLAERHGSLSVTSLMSGHGVFTKSGGVSLHSFGQALDIGAVGGVSVLGNQQPGGATEDALRSVMMLPPELQPSELISLFDMGGPSFAMADHHDHIHVGF